MTFSYKDNINRFSNYINNNCFIQSLFGNAFFVSLIISCLLIIIININNDNKTSQIIYSFITTFFIILVFNKIIKLQYLNKEKTGGEESFIKMMEDNSKSDKIYIIKNFDKNKDVNNDINAARDDINGARNDVEKFLKDKF
jgi:hypothetical protein